MVKVLLYDGRAGEEGRRIWGVLDRRFMMTKWGAQSSIINGDDGSGATKMQVTCCAGSELYINSVYRDGWMVMNDHMIQHQGFFFLLAMWTHVFLVCTLPSLPSWYDFSHPRIHYHYVYATLVMILTHNYPLSSLWLHFCTLLFLHICTLLCFETQDIFHIRSVARLDILHHVLCCLF